MLDHGKILDLLRRADWLAFAIQCLLLLFGVTFIYGAGVEIGGDFASKWYRQLIWIGLGLTLYFGVALCDLRRLGAFSWLIYLFGILFLVMVFPLGITLNSARSWLRLPGIGMFQPSEIAKATTLLFMSWIASRHAVRYSYLPIALPVFAVFFLPFVLVCAQPDYGTGLVFVPFTLAIVFITGIRWRWLLAGLLLAILGIPLLFLAMSNKQKERVKVFLEPPAKAIVAVLDDGTGREPAQSAVQPAKTAEEPETWRRRWSRKTEEFIKPPAGQARDNWNAQQSLLAVGSGGLTGKGFLKGTQHVLGYLPKTVAPTDFIFSVIAEETGFFGSAILLGLITSLILCYSRTALLSRNSFGSCLAIGVSAIFLTHTAINVGMTVQAAPIIGIPLPFVSYGGSFMLGAMLLAGLVQNAHIHRHEKEDGNLEE